MPGITPSQPIVPQVPIKLPTPTLPLSANAAEHQQELKQQPVVKQPLPPISANAAEHQQFLKTPEKFVPTVEKTPGGYDQSSVAESDLHYPYAKVGGVAMPTATPLDMAAIEAANIAKGMPAHPLQTGYIPMEGVSGPEAAQKVLDFNLPGPYPPGQGPQTTPLGGGFQVQTSPDELLNRSGAVPAQDVTGNGGGGGGGRGGQGGGGGQGQQNAQTPEAPEAPPKMAPDEMKKRLAKLTKFYGGRIYEMDTDLRFMLQQLGFWDQWVNLLTSLGFTAIPSQGPQGQQTDFIVPTDINVPDGFWSLLPPEQMAFLSLALNSVFGINNQPTGEPTATPTPTVGGTEPTPIPEPSPLPVTEPAPTEPAPLPILA